MGESNNLNQELKAAYIYTREKKINNFFEENEIQKLENINDYFIQQIIIDFSNFFKNSIKLVSCTIQTEIYNQNNIKNFSCINLIDTSLDKNKSFIIFSSNFLSVAIDRLFGGHNNFIEKINQKENITSAELFVNQKIMKFIIDCLNNSYKKFFSEKITFIHIKTLTNFKQFDFNFSEFFLISRFNFKINNIKIFFILVVSLSTINQLNKKIVIPKINDKKDIYIEKNISNTFLIDDIHDIKINITARIIDFSISDKKFNRLSVENIIPINKPDKIVLFIETKPIFFGSYKRFDEKYIIFIEELIHNHLESNRDEENTLMNYMKKNSCKEPLVDSEKNTFKHKNKQDLSQKKIDNKKILLDTVVNVTVELGRSKIKIKDFLGFSIGSVLVLDKIAKEPLDIFINGHLFASGEIVFLENKYGLRITDINDSFKKL